MCFYQKPSEQPPLVRLSLQTLQYLVRRKKAFKEPNYVTFLGLIHRACSY